VSTPAEDVDTTFNNPFVAGLVLAAIDDSARFKVVQAGGYSFVIRTKWARSRYRVTVERIPDDDEQEPGGDLQSAD
jgi:hypothetical protein